jgi:hypothetical protein
MNPVLIRDKRTGPKCVNGCMRSPMPGCPLNPVPNRNPPSSISMRDRATTYEPQQSATAQHLSPLYSLRCRRPWPRPRALKQDTNETRTNWNWCLLGTADPIAHGAAQLSYDLCYKGARKHSSRRRRAAINQRAGRAAGEKHSSREQIRMCVKIDRMTPRLPLSRRPWPRARETPGSSTNSCCSTPTPRTTSPTTASSSIMLSSLPSTPPSSSSRRRAAVAALPSRVRPNVLARHCTTLVSPVW